ncbi:MAG TPA: DUF6600 domain-containing protein [Stellaceae bacterium]|nr:DUF6600 domain-containing protein [Stellaceae bacterium]
MWIGRVSTVEGEAAIRPAAAPKTAGKPADWSDSAAVNDPVAAGMSVRTGKEGRMKLRSGPETIALSAATELDLAQLDAGGTQIVLRRGRIGIRLSQLDPAHSIEVDMPRGGVWLLTPGDYDITAGDAHTPSRVATFDGRARFVGKGSDTMIATGSAATLNGSDPVVATSGGIASGGAAPGGVASDDASFHGAKPDSPESDSFVAWWRSNPANAADRDPGAQALRYVSPEMTGYAALDGNGTWEDIAGYGAVWFPKAVADDWAPYRDGHWRWVAPWGWTWIDDMPWAFAPSHYGRWARLTAAEPGRERWGWVPGKPAEHPAYAPAVVAFLGTAGVGLSCPDAFAPGVAWFPLAPGEVYWPAYTDNPETIRALNVASVPPATALASGDGSKPPAAVLTAEYRNRRFASVVPRTVFLGGRPVAPALVKLPDIRLDNAPVLAGSPQIAPPPRAPVAIALATASTKVSGAVQTLARILAPRSRLPAVRAVVTARAAGRLERIPVRVTLATGPARRLHTRPVAAHSGTAHAARPRLISAPALRLTHQRVPRQRLHVASTRR